jgi:flagellar basal-body rod protein FlgC
MGLFDGLNISASGLTANRLWLDVIANNIANANTTRTPQGGPYRREEVVMNQTPFSSFSSALTSAMGNNSSSLSGGGVQVSGVVQDPSPFKVVYDPSSPDAVNGYVQMPNVNIATEMVDMLTAQQAYQANVTAFNSGKTIDVQSINIGK